MAFVINFQHRIPSKKLKKSNMLTKLPLKGKVKVGQAAVVVAFELATSKKELVCKPQHNKTNKTASKWWNIL
jgi:hypothetical protein